MAERIQVVLLRHGRSLADDERVHEGRYDSPLTRVGRAQVHARAEAWRASGVRFTRIVSSPLKRARESAEIIARVLENPLEFDEGWMERDNGPLAGLPFVEAARLYPEPDFRNPYEPLAGKGESEWQLHARAALALERVVRRAAASTLVVAHGGVLNAALRGLAGISVPINYQGLWFVFGDTAYARLDYHPGRHQWRMLELHEA